MKMKLMMTLPYAICHMMNDDAIFVNKSAFGNGKLLCPYFQDVTLSCKGTDDDENHISYIKITMPTENTIFPGCDSLMQRHI